MVSARPWSESFRCFLSHDLDMKIKAIKYKSAEKFKYCLCGWIEKSAGISNFYLIQSTWNKLRQSRFCSQIIEISVWYFIIFIMISESIVVPTGCDTQYIQMLVVWSFFQYHVYVLTHTNFNKNVGGEYLESTSYLQTGRNCYFGVVSPTNLMIIEAHAAIIEGHSNLIRSIQSSLDLGPKPTEAV